MRDESDNPTTQMSGQDDTFQVPFIDTVPNDRPFHKCNKFGDLVLTVTVLT